VIGYADSSEKSRNVNWFSPRRPQTGDGKTRRDIYDTPRVTFRDAGGRAMSAEPLKPVKVKKRKKK
jgi:hypothetical protein